MGVIETVSEMKQHYGVKNVTALVNHVVGLIRIAEPRLDSKPAEGRLSIDWRNIKRIFGHYNLSQLLMVEYWKYLDDDGRVVIGAPCTGDCKSFKKIVASWRGFNPSQDFSGKPLKSSGTAYDVVSELIYDYSSYFSVIEFLQTHEPRILDELIGSEVTDDRGVRRIINELLRDHKYHDIKILMSLYNAAYNTDKYIGEGKIYHKNPIYDIDVAAWLDGQYVDPATLSDSELMKLKLTSLNYWQLLEDRKANNKWYIANLSRDIRNEFADDKYKHALAVFYDRIDFKNLKHTLQCHLADLDFVYTLYYVQVKCGKVTESAECNRIVAKKTFRYSAYPTKAAIANSLVHAQYCEEYVIPEHGNHYLMYKMIKHSAISEISGQTLVSTYEGVGESIINLAIEKHYVIWDNKSLTTCCEHKFLPRVAYSIPDKLIHLHSARCSKANCHIRSIVKQRHVKPCVSRCV